MAITVTIGGTDVTDLVLFNTFSLTNGIGRRDTFACSIKSEDGSYAPAEGAPVIVEHSDLGTLFGGTIRKTQIALRGAVEIETRIQCSSWEQIFDRRPTGQVSFTDTPAGEVFLYIVTNYLSAEGIANVEAASGPNITVSFDFCTCAEAADAIAAQASSTDATYLWDMTPGKVARFYEAASYAAPINVTEDRPDIFRDIVVSRSFDSYVNKVFVRLGKFIAEAQTEEFDGDGDKTTFSFSLPLAMAPTVTVDDVELSVGIRDVDSGFDCYWQDGSNDVTFAVAPAAGSQNVDITARPYLSTVIDAGQNDAEVAARAAAESNSGWYMGVVESNTPSTSADGLAFGQAYLAKFSRLPCSVDYRTTYGGVKAGMYQTVALTKFGPDFSATFVVESSTLVHQGGQWFWRVTSINGAIANGWLQKFRKIISGGGSSTASGGGGSVVIGPGGGPAPAAPNVTAEWLSGVGTWTHVPLRRPIGGDADPSYGYQGNITPPGSVDTSHLREIIITRVSTDGSRLQLGSPLAGPFPVGITREFHSDAVDLDPDGVSLEFACKNEDGLTTANPYTVAIVGPADPLDTPAPVEVSISAMEALPTSTTRHKSPTGGLNITLQITPVVQNPVYPYTITILTTRPARNRQTGERVPTMEWRGWHSVTGPGPIYLGQEGTPTEYELWAPTGSDEQWTVSFCLGKIYAGDPLPASAKTSAPFLVAAPGIPTTSEAGSAYIDQVLVGTGNKRGMFGWNAMYCDLPFADPELFYARWTVQNGHYATPSNPATFVGGGQHGGREVPFTDYDGQNVYRIPGTDRTVITNPLLWDVPDYKLENGALNPDNVFRVKVYVGSRYDADGVGGTMTQQFVWSPMVGDPDGPFSVGYQDIVLNLNDGRPMLANAATSSSSNAHKLPGATIPFSGDGTLTLDPFDAVSVNQFVLSIANMAGALTNNRISDLSSFNLFNFSGQTDVQRVSGLPFVDLYGLSGGPDVQRKSGLGLVNVLSAFANSGDLQQRSTLTQTPLSSFFGGITNDRIVNLSQFSAFNFQGATDIQRVSTLGFLNLFNFQGAADVQRVSALGQVNVFAFANSADIQRISTLSQYSIFNFSGAADIQRISALGNVQINVFGGQLNVNLQIGEKQIGLNKVRIEELQISSISGWDGASINCGSGFSWFGLAGRVYVDGSGFYASPARGSGPRLLAGGLFLDNFNYFTSSEYRSGGEAGLTTGAINPTFMRFNKGLLVAYT